MKTYTAVSLASIAMASIVLGLAFLSAHFSPSSTSSSSTFWLHAVVPSLVLAYHSVLSVSSFPSLRTEASPGSNTNTATTSVTNLVVLSTLILICFADGLARVMVALLSPHETTIANTFPLSSIALSPLLISISGAALELAQASVLVLMFTVALQTGRLASMSSDAERQTDLVVHYEDELEDETKDL